MNNTTTLKSLVLFAVLMIMSSVASFAGINSDDFSGQTVRFTTVYREAAYDSAMFVVSAASPTPQFVLDNTTIGEPSAPITITATSTFSLFVVNTAQLFGENRLTRFGAGVYGWEDWVDGDYNDFVFTITPIIDCQPPDAVPEPSTYAMLGFGLLVVAIKQKSNKPIRLGW